MRIKFLKLQNWLLLSAMSLFGLSACHNSKNITDDDDKRPEQTEPAKVMYGGPSTNYKKPDPVVIIQPDPKSPDENQSQDEEQPKAKNQPVNQTDTMQQPIRPPHKVKPREPEKTVYGVPTVDFSVKGRVVDSQGKPIKGMQVMLINSDIDIDNMPDTEHWKKVLARISDTTDSKGDFEVNTSDRPWEKIRLLINDVDGAKNGSFERQVIDVPFNEAPEVNKPMSAWKLGRNTAEVTVKMKRKKK